MVTISLFLCLPHYIKGWCFLGQTIVPILPCLCLLYHSCTKTSYIHSFLHEQHIRSYCHLSVTRLANIEKKISKKVNSNMLLIFSSLLSVLCLSAPGSVSIASGQGEMTHLKVLERGDGGKCSSMEERERTLNESIILLYQ